MKRILPSLLFVILLSCKNNLLPGQQQAPFQSETEQKIIATRISDSSSWPYFLQHLPEGEGPVVDYKGKPVSYQDKHFSVIKYDVGDRDLQQCADALMRLRAEYLFLQNRPEEIGFHFTGGQYYRFADYCNGRKPVPKGADVTFISSSPQPKNHLSLRRYLDIVYTYAGTISLAAELKKADGFGIGTIVITPGSPGHCFIIADEATDTDGNKLYKLIEGYTPAQSIYVLRNTSDPSLGYWHRLEKGTIETASYEFKNYSLKKFE